MASIRTRQQKNGTMAYRAVVRVVGFPEQSATFRKLRDAKAWSSQVEADMRAGRYTSDAAAREHTAREMIDRYMRDVLPVKSEKKRYIDSQRSQLNWWKRRIGDYQLIRVTPFLLVECRDELRRGGRKPATVNRYFSALSHVFTITRSQWNWLQKNPMSDVSRLPEPRGRVRYLTRSEVGKLLQQCQRCTKKPLYDVVVMALATGARKDEILSIERRHVDLDAGRIVLEETKNNERRQLSISGVALQVMQQRMQGMNASQSYVFTGVRRSIKLRIDKEFRAACDRAGIADFHFHDLRHTFASYLAMNGASLAEIAEALGHKTLNMVKRYAHLSNSHTSKVIADMNSKLFADTQETTSTAPQSAHNMKQSNIDKG